MFPDVFQYALHVKHTIYKNTFPLISFSPLLKGPNQQQILASAFANSLSIFTVSGCSYKHKLGLSKKQREILGER